MVTTRAHPGGASGCAPGSPRGRPGAGWAGGTGPPPCGTAAAPTATGSGPPSAPPPRLAGAGAGAGVGPAARPRSPPAGPSRRYRGAGCPRRGRAGGSSGRPGAAGPAGFPPVPLGLRVTREFPPPVWFATESHGRGTVFSAVLRHFPHPAAAGGVWVRCVRATGPLETGSRAVVGGGPGVFWWMAEEVWPRGSGPAGGHRRSRMDVSVEAMVRRLGVDLTGGHEDGPTGFAGSPESAGFFDFFFSEWGGCCGCQGCCGSSGRCRCGARGGWHG
ncbi:hypothetical protein P3T27_003245 [Kitasatospora sp. MAA19]|nr:hypothetical protein [Kitasatospora sp. MAA19]